MCSFQAAQTTDCWPSAASILGKLISPLNSALKNGSSSLKEMYKLLMSLKCTREEGGKTEKETSSEEFAEDLLLSTVRYQGKVSYWTY